MSKNRNKRSLEDSRLESSSTGNKDDENDPKIKQLKPNDDTEDDPSDSNNTEQNTDDIEEENEDDDEFDSSVDDDAEDKEDEENDEDEEDEENDEDEENEESSDINSLSDKEISVEFTAHDPVEQDFHGIRCLLKQLWLKENIPLTELTWLIISDTISTVLKQSYEIEDEDDLGEDDEEIEDNVFGVISIIPFTGRFDDRECVQKIKQVLLSYLPVDHEIYKILNHSESTCALIINERFVNLPPKISVPCYKQMLTELNAHKEQHPFSIKYEFDYVLMIAKLSKYRNECIYSNGEDELFSNRAEATYEYSVAKQADYTSLDWNDDEKTFEPFRKILLLKKAKWIRTINVLKDEV